MNDSASESGDQQRTLNTIKEIVDAISEAVKQIPEINDIQRKRISQKAMGIILKKKLSSYTLEDIQQAIDEAIKSTQSGQKDLATQQREAISGNLELVFPKDDDDLSATG